MYWINRANYTYLWCYLFYSQIPHCDQVFCPAYVPLDSDSAPDSAWDIASNIASDVASGFASGFCFRICFRIRTRKWLV